MCRAITLLLVTSTLVACSMDKLPPPAAPPKVVPVVPDIPEQPPADGIGRVLIDTDGEPAKVARVVESGPVRQQELRVQRGLPVQTYPVTQRKTELLCITPCAVDLKTGAHTLQLTSTRAPERTSTADVAVPRGTTVVRHALGSERRLTSAYSGGVQALFVGTPLTLMGGLMVLGASLDETLADNPGGARTFNIIGAVVGGVGVVALVAGAILMAGNRPEKRPGATTTFPVSP